MNNKGMAMLIVISLILMLLILGGTVMMISTGHFGTSYHQVARTKASYAGEAAMQHVLWALRTGNLTPPVDNTFEYLFPAQNFDVNGVEGEDITVKVDLVNPLVTDPPGVSPIEIRVDY